MKQFPTADYGTVDESYQQPAYFVRKTTAEITALIAAKTIGSGTLYFDTTLSQFKIGYDAVTVVALTSANMSVAGLTITSSAYNGTVGATTPSSVRATTYASGITDSSGTPGNVTNNACHGRAAFSAAGSTVVVTSSLCAANSTVLVALGGADATLTSVRVTPGAGSFTVTGNAAATATTVFDFVIITN